MKCRIAIALLFAAIGVFAGDIFLIGDSIRQGYAPEVKRICAEHGKNVYCPKENCKFSQFTYRFLHKWASSVKDPSSVEAVHWNNGLWDLGEVVPGECTTPIEMYTNMLVRTAREIRRLFPAARIVFATTTPVNTLVNDKWHTRGNVEVERYNALALTALEGEVDAINDLYAYVKEKSLEKYYKDTVHFTPDGYKALAERVVSAIEQALSSPVATRGGNEKNMKSVAEYVSEEPGFQRELKGARFKFSCNRPDAVYKLGEVAKFTIRPVAADGTALTGAVVKVSVDNFGEHIVIPQFSREAGKDGVIEAQGTLITPGFLRVKASMGEGKSKVSGYWSVAYEPEKIVPGTDDVDDFDEFWAEAKRKLEEEIPLDMKCRKVEELSKEDKDFYVFEFNTCGGRRMNGSLTVPKKLKPPYPVRIRLPGAGCGVGANRVTALMPFDDALCMMVYPFDWPQAITGSLDKVLAKYDNFWGECVKKYGVPWYCAGISESREEFFYYSVILGANRAVEWLRSPDSGFEVDRDNFVYAGASQGGGLGLALLYLSDAFRKGVIHVAGLSDMKGFLHNSRQGGWPAIVQAHHPRYRAAVADRIRYFDGVNFARRLKLPVWFTAGYADGACPPAGIWATYNACGSKEKRISGMIGYGHAVDKTVEDAIEKWLKE